MPLPLLAIGGAAVGNELNKSGGGIFGKALGGIKGLFSKGASAAAKAASTAKAKGEMAKLRAVLEMKKQGMSNSEAVATVQRIAGKVPSVDAVSRLNSFALNPIMALGDPNSNRISKAVNMAVSSDSVSVEPSSKTQSSSKEMNGLGQFMQGVSGGFTFGQNQKLVNIAFWVIGGIVVILIIRPFGILSGKRKK